MVYSQFLNAPRPEKSLGRLKPSLVRFWRDTSGNFAILTAVLSVAVTGVVGIAFDIERAIQARKQAQSALDAALVAGVHYSEDVRDEKTTEFFKANLTMNGLSVRSVEWETESANAFRGTAHLGIPTTFTQIFNVQQLEVAVAGEVYVESERTPTNATFQLLSAKGWNWKQIQLWTREADTGTASVVATYTYQPTDLRNGGSGVVSGPIGKSVDLGQNYKEVFLTMDVSTDGCGPKERPTHPEAIDSSNSAYWNPYTCISATTTKPKTVSIYTFRSNEAATANHFFIDGEPFDVEMKLSDFIKCGETVQQSWEDTYLYDQSSQDSVNAWKTQDLYFNVTGGSCVENKKYLKNIRLSN